MAVWTAQQRTQQSHSRRWLAEVLAALDARLRRRQAVFEYTRNPACVFRLDITRPGRSFVLRDGTAISPARRIARLHFWNEQIPPVPRSGATIGWARRMQRAIATSLRELATYLASRPDLGDVDAVCAVAPSGTKTQINQLARIMARYGFEAIDGPERLPIGKRLHRFGENILISLFVLAHNPAALRPDTLKRARLAIYLSRRVLEKEFGN
jgi:hypothetical protein